MTWIWMFLALQPNPELGPEEVVRTVADALRHNNAPMPNSGIFTAYRFASPENHAETGPYGRFLLTVKTADFAPMLHEYTGEFGPLRMSGDRAEQLLRIPAAHATFRFVLSRQKAGTYRGCWMVDGVLRE